MIGRLIGEAGGWLAGAGAALAALLAVWWRSRASAHRETALEAAERYAKSRKEMDNAPDFGNDPDAARRWLRERAESGRDL